MANDNGCSWGLLIPIVVLLLVMIGTREPWLLLPIIILTIIFLSGRNEEKKMQSRASDADYWRAPESGTYASGHIPEPRMDGPKPLYDQKKRKEEGITCGTFIPIIIVGWLYLQTYSWIFLIPLVFLFLSLLDNISKQSQGKSEVREELRRDSRGSVSDISDRTGIPVERVRQHIVTEKRKGESDVWFDPSSGEMTSSPIRVVDEPAEKTVGCTYCGFALKPADRFCPFCGAPIKA